VELEGESDAEVRGEAADEEHVADAEPQAAVAESEQPDAVEGAPAGVEVGKSGAPTVDAEAGNGEDAAGEQQGTEGGKRRRGRRGGRGRRRGKGGDKAAADAHATNGDQAVAETAAEAAGPADDAAAPERTADAAAATAPALEVREQPAKPPARPSGRARIASPEDVAPTARGGRRKLTVDLPLVPEEEEPEIAPIAPPTARRPRSYRDLDSIPDDFD
jgi:ribonuclease E